MDSHKLIDKPVVMNSDPLTVSEIREYRNSAPRSQVKFMLL